MKLFLNTNSSLSPVDTDAFARETDIHSLVEANLQTIFDLELELVDSEFAIDGFRLDSLAFDKRNKSFVIIEYKKGTSYSVIDQGYSYLGAMLNNKAHFILEYSQKTGKQLKKTDVDWASSRVIFVSPSFSHYQKSSVNFKDMPFELWEIKKFANNLVAIEQWEPSSSASIQELSKGVSRSVISKVASEVKEVSEEEHVSKLAESMKPVWTKLRERLAEYPDTAFSPTKNYISWTLGRPVICYINFYKNSLRLDILRGSRKGTDETSKGFFTLDDFKGMAEKKVSNSGPGETYHEYHIKLNKLEDLNDVILLLEQKYKSMA